MKSYNNDELSKKRALKLFDSGEVDRIEVGTIEGLQFIHRYLFDGIAGYDAGQVRNVNLSKDNFRFASAIYLPQALETISGMPEDTFGQIIEKYVEMNVAHPFIEGNGRSSRIWLDLILKKSLRKCVDWSKVSKREYLDFMRLSPTNGKYIQDLLESALTENINDRDVFMKGIDQSYEYEDSDAKSIFELDND